MSQENVEVVRLVVEGVEAGVALGDLGAAFDLGVDGRRPGARRRADTGARAGRCCELSRKGRVR